MANVHNFTFDNGHTVRGIFSEEQYSELTKKYLCKLQKKGIQVSSVYYCPHHPSFSEKPFDNCGVGQIGQYFSDGEYSNYLFMKFSRGFTTFFHNKIQNDIQKNN